MMKDRLMKDRLICLLEDIGRGIVACGIGVAATPMPRIVTHLRAPFRTRWAEASAPRRHQPVLAGEPVEGMPSKKDDVLSRGTP